MSLYRTVTVHDVLSPLFVVAVIVTIPGAIPLTLPLASTVAIAGLLLAHVTVLKSVFLGEIVALSEAFLPAFTVSAAFESLTAVGKTGETLTIQLAAAPLPSRAVQVITAIPPALPVTTPELETVAIFLLLDVHCTFLLLAVTGAMAMVNFTFCVRASVVSDRFSEIDETGCLTVIVFLTVVVFNFTLPFLSTARATIFVMIVTLPPAINVMLPLASTVATVGFEELYAIDVVVYPLGTVGGMMVKAVPALAFEDTLLAAKLPI